MFISNNRTSFDLRWNENLVKHQKVSKYYETGCRNKLNRIESKISEALINNEIIHEDFMTIINKEKQYRELKESIGMMNSQRSVVEEIKRIEEGKKKIGIIEVIKRNKIINNSLKP